MCSLSQSTVQLVDALEWCSELGVTHVSAFAFGVENFKRTAEEVDTIMQLAEEKLRYLAQVAHSSLLLHVLRAVPLWLLQKGNWSCFGWPACVSRGAQAGNCVVQDSDLIPRHQVRVNIMGQLDMLPPGVQAAAQEVVQASKQYQGLVLNICLAYS